MIVSGVELEAIWQTLKSNLQTPYIASKCEIWSLKKLAIGEVMSIGVLKLIFNQGIIVVFLKSIDALRRLVKNEHFTVRLIVRGGGGSASSALTVSKCENVDTFFH